MTSDSLLLSQYRPYRTVIVLDITFGKNWQPWLKNVQFSGPNLLCYSLVCLCIRFSFLLCGCQIEPLTAVGKISHDNVIDIVLINFDVDEASGVGGGG